MSEKDKQSSDAPTSNKNLSEKQNEGPEDSSTLAKDPKTPNSTGSWLPEASWATSWMNTAKEKTKSTFEIIKKDINEFSDTLQNETHSLASAAAKKAQEIGQIIVPTPAETEGGEGKADEEKKQSNAGEILDSTEANVPPAEDKDGKGMLTGGLNWVKQMASEVVETVHKFATEDTTKEEARWTEEVHLGPAGRKTLLNQCILLQMQNDRSTFLEEPQPELEEMYNEWLSDFKISEYNGEINLLLGQNPRLREIYAELVPSQVDNHTFWHRYFFKVYVKEAKKRRSLQEEEGKELKISTDKSGTAPSSNGHSPAPSSNNGNGKDDWSMCSGGRTIAEAEELEAEEATNGREEMQTPRPPTTTKKCQQAQSGDGEEDDWEECDGGEGADIEKGAK